VPIVSIDDPADPRVDDYRTLRDAELRKRYEHQAGVFIAEGPNVVRELLTSRYPTRSLLCDPRRAAELAPLVEGTGIPVFVVEREVLYDLVAFRAHQGALACGSRVPPLEPADVVAGARRLLVLDAMNDHENMGAIFRTARALDADGVLLGPRSADPLYRRSVRVSMGHVLHVPHAPIGALPQSLAPLREAGLTTVALTPDTEAPTIDALDRTRPLALLLGAEGPGLEHRTMEAADVRARIPMRADVDSLNVAATAAVALFALRDAPV
jgi:tRNA G18 (ribose-2'-O)-methylase SpoU